MSILKTKDDFALKVSEKYSRTASDILFDYLDKNGYTIYLDSKDVPDPKDISLDAIFSKYIEADNPIDFLNENKIYVEKLTKYIHDQCKKKVLRTHNNLPTGYIKFLKGERQFSNFSDKDQEALFNLIQNAYDEDLHKEMSIPILIMAFEEINKQDYYVGGELNLFIVDISKLPKDDNQI